MPEIPALDKQIRDLRAWIQTAAESLLPLYNSSTGLMYHNSDEIIRPEPTVPAHPQTTNRAFFALKEYLRFLAEEDIATASRERALSTLRGIVANYHIPLIDDRNLHRNTERRNMFADSQLLLALSLIDSTLIVDPNFQYNKLYETILGIAAENIEALVTYNGGKIHPTDDVHDMITYYLIRVIEMFPYLGPSCLTYVLSSILDRVRSRTMELLGLQYAGLSSKFDPGELAFCVAILNRTIVPDAANLTERAIQDIATSQAPNGGWPSARLISHRQTFLLHVTSYDVGIAMTSLAHRMIQEDKIAGCDIIFNSLSKCFDLVKSRFNAVRDLQRWSNDFRRRQDLIETWATAIVLTFLIQYHDALQSYRQALVLEKYRPATPPSLTFPRPPYGPASGDIERPLPNVLLQSDEAPWPELLPASRCLTVDLRGIDPLMPIGRDNLRHALDREYVHPVQRDWIRRPKSASLVLWGPPGTGKTTIAEEIARSLQWPMITLSPPVFLKNGGLDGVEAAAADVFDDLLRLKRVVVLFDEMEEFFKSRPTTGKVPNQDQDSMDDTTGGLVIGSDQFTVARRTQAHNARMEATATRTTAAFITAGMLPRIEALRTKRWVIFVLATNSHIDELDPAAIRIGRFDYSHHVDILSLDEQLNFVYTSKSPHSYAIGEALKRYDDERVMAEQSGRPTRDPVLFKHLDTLISRVDTLASSNNVVTPHVDAIYHELCRLASKRPPDLLS